MITIDGCFGKRSCMFNSRTAYPMLLFVNFFFFFLSKIFALLDTGVGGKYRPILLVKNRISINRILVCGPDHEVDYIIFGIYLLRKLQSKFTLRTLKSSIFSVHNKLIYNIILISQKCFYLSEVV